MATSDLDARAPKSKVNARWQPVRVLGHAHSVGLRVDDPSNRGDDLQRRARL